MIAIIAAAAPVIVHLPRNVRIPVVVVEILAGIVVGPRVLGIAGTGDIVVFLSNVGLAFLFFLAGMEIDFERVRGRPAQLARYRLGDLARPRLRHRRGADGDRLREQHPAHRGRPQHVGTRHADAHPERRRRGRYAARHAHDRHGRRRRVRAFLAISLLLTGAAGPGVNAALLLAFAVVAAGVAVLALRVRHPAIVRTIEHAEYSSGQFAIRLAILILMCLVYLTGEFGLDVVLGAFAAGIVVGLVTKSDEAEQVRGKLEK